MLKENDTRTCVRNARAGERKRRESGMMEYVSERERKKERKREESERTSGRKEMKRVNEREREK